MYLDNSATTQVSEEVFKEMEPYFIEEFGNPSTLYGIGCESKKALNLARQRVADSINAKPEEIIFTSGGSESDNLAIKGVAFKLAKKGKHIITTNIEHPAVKNTLGFLESLDFKVTYLPVNADGVIEIDDLKEAITDETILITVMHANNEIGTIQPIGEIGKIAREKGIKFHVDAVQSFGKIEVDVEKLNIDLLSLSSHKINGPKGVGALYIRKGTKISNFLYGGAQESKHRAGTENVAGIVAFGKAAELADVNFDEHVKHSSQLRDYMMAEIEKRIPDVYVNGDKDHRHPGNLNVTFKKIEGESILLMLNHMGISVSTGSACSSKSLEPSHVLTALGVNEEDIHGTIRFTVGDFTTKEDVDYVLDTLEEIVTRLREISAIR